MVSFEDFSKLDIRIGQVKQAEKVEQADKLLRLVFDVGGGEERQIIAGIAEFIDDPGQLVGRQFPLLLNIEPRKLKGLVSNGMILAIDDGDGLIFLQPENQAKPGSKVR